MKTIRAIASRPSDLALGMVALANIAFLLLFLASLFVSIGKARAETPACTGKDMIAALAQDDPALLASIRSQAEAEINGKGLFWKVEKDGVAPSFLFGTMHMTDPRVTTMPEAVSRALDGAQTVVIETLDVLDPAKMTALMLEQPDLLMFTDDRNFVDLIPEADRPMVEAAFASRGIPLTSLRKTKPWIVAALVALPQCELARKTAGAPVLDLDIAAKAKTAGKRLEGLESMRDQLEAMASLPMSFHIDGLVETVRLGDRMDDVIETMVVLYQSGEVGMFWPFFRAVLPSGGGDEGYAAFQEAMIVSRNRAMADSARPLLDGGSAFIAIGALHLSGKQGLVELLSERGFSVTPVL